MYMNKMLPMNKQFFSTKDLYDLGFSYYKIMKMVDEGKLVKLNKSTYENTSYTGDVNDFSTLCAYIPKGVICMLSAARFYELTTYLPDAVDIAIERSMKVSTRPVWPATNIWFFPEERYASCVNNYEINGDPIKIYSIEKTVADIIYYRNKVGIEETKEILTNYLKRKDRDLVELHRLAEKLGCKKILQTYLEVLI